MKSKGEGKPQFPEKTSRCRVANQQTQPTFDAGSGNRTRASLVEGECSNLHPNDSMGSLQWNSRLSNAIKLQYLQYIFFKGRYIAFI